MKIFYTLTILIIGNICYAQKNISPASQKAITEILSSEISKLYFNTDIAKSIADTLTVIKTQIKNENTIGDFTNILNSALYKKSNDNHLKIYFDTSIFNSYSADEKVKRDFDYQLQKKINFGFTQVDVLEGNIGYLEITRFSGFVGEEVARKITSAMNLVESTNALIIDLRKNGGGDGRVGEILETYFFPEENEIYYDSISKTEKFRVLPFVSGKRYLNRPVYILTGLSTFSAAEGFTNSMQKNKKAVVVGEKTKGGGSVGSSVPILDGFLCFIPTSVVKSDEDASVKPDFITLENNALIFAKHLFYKEELKKCTNENNIEILKWNIKTSEYLLKIIDKKFTLNKKFIGTYESSKKIFLKNNQLFLSFNKSEFKLVQIGDEEFVVEGFENTFGAGNRRIVFNDNGFDEVIYLNGQLVHKFRKKL